MLRHIGIYFISLDAQASNFTIRKANYFTFAAGESPSNALRELGSEVRALHIRDNDGKSDLHKIPFEGIIDWADFAQALQEVGYQGVFSYETAPSAAVSLEDAEHIYTQMLETANRILNSCKT